MYQHTLWTSTGIALWLAFSFCACTSADGGTDGSNNTSPAATGGSGNDNRTDSKGGTSTSGANTTANQSKGGTNASKDTSESEGGAESVGGKQVTGGKTGIGGKSSSGGTTTEQGGSTDGGQEQSSCVAGVNTGDVCNPDVDTAECVRSTRSCTCEATGQWNCVTRAGTGGTTGAGGATGVGGKSETVVSSSTGGKAATGGAPSTGGVTGNGGTGGAKTTAAGGATATGGAGTGPSSGPAGSMGYVGCSMSVNVLQGYTALGGKRLWGPQGAYNGMVVQNWANANDNVWKTFEQQASQNGTPTAVWVMICIFSNQVTYDETKQIIANVRKRAPNATIYITGQPLYAQGLSCDLAGQGGPEKTDSMAKQAAEDATQNVIYGGVFGPLTSSQRSDSCHANTEGQKVLGQQAIDKWGK